MDIRRSSLAIIIIVIVLMLVSTSCIGRSTGSTSILEVEKDTPVVYISLAEALSNGKPTLAEFGSTTCVSCKMMKIVLDDLAVEYEGKVNVVIIDVYEHRDLARQYGIMSIPTQIFFDSNGNLLMEHIGILSEETIIANLNDMGID